MTFHRISLGEACVQMGYTFTPTGHMLPRGRSAPPQWTLHVPDELPQQTSAVCLVGLDHPLSRIFRICGAYQF